MTEKKTAKTAKSAQRKAGNPFVGRWRITWMEQWDQEFVDEEVEGFFAFELNGCGSFQFGYVRGQIDYRHSTRDGNPCLEFRGTVTMKWILLKGVAGQLPKVNNLAACCSFIRVTNRASRR